MIKAIAWGVGLAVINVAVSTWMSKTVHGKVKAADEEYKKYIAEAKQGE